jgi:isocitrate dehydrogenase kinase/phosphatase
LKTCRATPAGAGGHERRGSSQVKLRANFQIQVLSSLFFRNKGAYVVGKIINGFNEVPFALPILHGRDGQAGD